jgi:geranylgeranyl diphosphate synthase, type II
MGRDGVGSMAGCTDTLSEGQRVDSLPERLPGVYAKFATLIDATLERVLAEQEDTSAVWDAMRYTPLLGGKRLRPILVCIAAEIAGRAGEDVVLAACGTELAHSASLILDDLPCMDGAVERRWQPAAHLIFGEANAILGSVSLIALGFDLLARNARALGVDAGVTSAVVQRTGFGIREVAYGQSLDLALQQGAHATSRILENCYWKKTGGVLSLSLSVGAQLAGASRAHVEALEAFGYELGVAFQLVDDLLDFQNSSVFSGKTAPAEEGRTYASLCGYEPTVDRAREIAASARARLVAIGDAAAPLRALVDAVIDDRLASILSAQQRATRPSSPEIALPKGVET